MTRIRLILSRSALAAGLLLAAPKLALADSAGGDQPVATVSTAIVKETSISERIPAYGSVVARPGATESISVAYETRVVHILVAPGQPVNAGDPVVDIAPSPAALLRFHQAQSNLETAKTDFARVKKQFDMQLATNQELSQARKSLTDAKLELQSLTDEGVTSKNILRAQHKGVISAISAQDGQIVPGGSPLIELVAGHQIEVKLGVEPEAISYVHKGDTLPIVPVNRPVEKPVQGTVRLVTRRINPHTRLVDVFVSLPETSDFFLQDYVRAEISHTVNQALVVPHSAVLPDNGTYQIFTVVNGHAKAHKVRLGIENDSVCQVIGGGIKPGDHVVTVGNYELEDGMPVEIAK